MPEQTPETKAKRTKDPSYLVFKLAEGQTPIGESGTTWLGLTLDPVRATTRKDAIRQATKGEGVGTFMVVKADAAVVLTRGVETKPEEKWS